MLVLLQVPDSLKYLGFVSYMFMALSDTKFSIRKKFSSCQMGRKHWLLCCPGHSPLWLLLWEVHLIKLSFAFQDKTSLFKRLRPFAVPKFLILKAHCCCAASSFITSKARYKVLGNVLNSACGFTDPPEFNFYGITG